MKLSRHARFLYQPCLPLGKNGKMVTNSPAHWRLAKEAATEGTVLLKNDGALPLKKGSKVCLFGIGAGEFLCGGGGSGRVFADREITLADGLLAAANRGEIEFFYDTVPYSQAAVKNILDKAHEEYPVAARYQQWRRGFHMPLIQIPEEMYQKAVAFGDTAIFCVSRYSSEGDTDGDRPGSKGDFYLWEEEQQLLERLYADFEKVIVVINSCGPVSTREYDQANALLYPLYGGGIAGESLTDILLGHAYPSGHLQHTLAYDITDYPSTAGFHDDMYFVNYTEDIFVGYRYFETFAPDKAAYPFGFGLSYTTFSRETTQAVLEKNTVKLTVQVTNTGAAAGKEVVQAYLTAPQGKLGKAKKVLSAFGKTKELQPGQSQLLKLHVDIREFGSFDDLGKILESAFILEKGDYTVWVGNNVRDVETALQFTLEQDIICKKCNPYMAPKDLPERLCADGSYEKLPAPPVLPHPIRRSRVKAQKPEADFSLATALKENRMEEFIASLTDEDLGEFLYGHPMMNASNTFGIGIKPRYERRDEKVMPLIPTADGPMGLRIRTGRGISPTFFPCESVISQTWNLPLAKKVGATIALETKENNIGIWLAPALNIHRNPMCGRNFEYYSEDPLTSGLFAAYVVMGVQSQRICATIKHFCANSRENHRRLVDSRVSQRALREIYLRGFEIAIKKGKPWALMTSYNPVNGAQSSKNWEAINGVLRTDWGYDGVVMTDWRVLSNLEEEIHAGSDVKMPESVTTFYEHAPKTCDPTALMHEGKLAKGAVLLSVRRILKLMSKLD